MKKKTTDFDTEVLRAIIRELASEGLTEAEIRRTVEQELNKLRQ